MIIMSIVLAKIFMIIYFAVFMKVHQLYILDCCILVYLEQKKASLSFEDKIQLNT